MSRRDEAVVFFVVVALVIDFEEGFKTFLVAGSALVFALVLEVDFTGLAATLVSLISFFTVAFFVVSLASLVAVSFLVADLFPTEDFVAFAAVAVDLDLEADLAGTFFVEVVLEDLAGLFCSRNELCS